MGKFGTKRFDELQVWMDSQDLAVGVYALTKAIGDYSFNDQIKRAAVSISNNIAEGSERKTNSDFARFLDIAKGSCGEVRSMLFLGIKLDLFSSQKANALVEQTFGISKQLSSFSQFLRDHSY